MTEQVVPVTAIGSEPRSVETQHGADLAGAEPRHQPLEAGPRHHPAGGAAEIVVDYLNVTETPLPRHFDKIVLPPLALEIGLDRARSDALRVSFRELLPNRTEC